jgi:ABC-type transporter Mla subunit MlaD
MDSKKVSNLLRAVADLMDNTTEVVQETQKDMVKTIEKNTNDYLEHSLKLMRKIEDNDTIRAYKNKMGKQNKVLSEALLEIQKLRENAIEDMIRDAKGISNPIDFFNKTVSNTEKLGRQFVKEGEILNKAITQE